MKPVADILEEKITAAIAEVTGQSYPAIVKPAVDAKFGDYQANGVMAAAKKLKTKPRELAEKIVAKLDIDNICQAPEIAGPGFINLRLKTDFIAENLLEIAADKDNRLGLQKIDNPKTIVVDFSGPNIAKQMHVGHLRSTIIGDCICRVLEFLGHTVIRQNHIGDWGTQFGMLAHYLDYRNFYTEEDIKKGKMSGRPQLKIPDMEQFYKEAKKLFDTEAKFAKKSRDYVVDLHSGKRTHALLNWEIIRNQSLAYCELIYEKLGVNLHRKDVRGESEYNKDLSAIVEDLKKQGLAVESDGAICVFPEGFKNKEGQPLPFIIQKSDGAYLYATTDLAAIRYRINQLKADRIIYVTDARQSLHFQMLFAVVRMAGWVADETELSHVSFGSVLGEDGAPLKTRSGENVKLKDLLTEAVERAKTVVEEKNPGLDVEKKNQIAKAVGTGAVKYADYSNNRTSDYIFSFDKMLAMEGNTAPYMQYAYARIKSIERKALIRDLDIETELADIDNLNLTEPAELDLAKHIIRYGEVIESAAVDYRPNYLTNYLYELAQKFSIFYTNCPVLKAADDKRPTRLMLCDLTSKTIAHGLKQLLGIEVVEQM